MLAGWIIKHKTVADIVLPWRTGKGHTAKLYVTESAAKGVVTLQDLASHYEVVPVHVLEPLEHTWEQTNGS